MKNMDIYKSPDEIAWCPGCGNFGILNSVKKSLSKLDLDPNKVLLVSGIGQAAKLPHYIKGNCFNGLHGRALPVAAAAKMVNPELTVLVTTGDGDCYGEGGNHFIHNVRRNVDMTVVVHNNQIYGLTKGQASPTTDRGYVTKVQTQGVILEPFHALAVAIILGAGFVARGFSRDSDQLSDLIAAAVRHKGFSLVEVLQPCVTFNKKNTYDWYKERIYNVSEDKSYDASNQMAAIKTSLEWNGRIPTGIIYNKETKAYEELAGVSAGAQLTDSQVDIKETLRDFM